MEWIVGDALLAQDSPEPGVGAYIGFQLTIQNNVGQRGRPDDFELKENHAVAFFRLGGKKDGALFFMDSNCGVYHIYPGKLSAFLQAWVKGYEESPFEMTSPYAGKGSVVKTSGSLQS